MGRWTKRLIIIVPGATLNTTRKNAMGQIFVTGNSREALVNESALFDGVGLSESGNEPATHFATNTMATDDIDTNLRSFIDSNFPIGSDWWQVNPSTELLEAKSSRSSGMIGRIFTFGDALDDSGMKIIEREI